MQVCLVVILFYNIPYATAPTGNNKFKAPLPPPVFETSLDAIDRSIICPQPGGLMNMKEDCLVANVFVPDTTTADSRIPVLVIVHGGAYQNGYGEQDKFRELAKTKKVIVVTFNYRLGVHGFLCLGTEGAPGNAGLKDQVALLRWVNTNIRHFGGNPKDVTLAACRTGSDSVDFLTTSTITKGLFKKAIMESGVSTGAVGVQINPIENAKTYATLLGFNGDDWSSLEDFYKTATFQQLLSRQVAIVNNQAILFGPCVESDIGQERVVLNAPFSVLKQGNYTKIPLMYGFTNMDGTMRLPSLDAWKDRVNDKFSDFLPAELYFESEDVKEDVAQRVKHFYFGDKLMSEDYIQKYITYFTDVLFRYPMLRSLSTRVKVLSDPIYLLEYSFVDEQIEVFPNANIQEAGYCQQFIAVMDEDVTDRTEEYKKMKHTLREYWHSFILNGVPSSSDSDLPTWKRAGARRSPRMSLGPVIELKNDNVFDGRATFWDEIYEKHFSPVVYTTNRRTTKRPTNIQTTRATSNPITSAPNTVTSNPITSTPNTVTSNPITSAPNTVTSNPGTSATIDTGGFEPITSKTTTTSRATASSSSDLTSTPPTTANTTTSTTTERTTYSSIIVSNPPPGSGVADSIVISNVLFLVVFCHFISIVINIV